MINEKSAGILTGTGVLSAIAASLCCVTPVIALLAGSGGIAVNLSWMDPFRPYLIGGSMVALGLAWFLKLKPKAHCDCAVERKVSFLQSKAFLVSVTLFATLVIAFPYYAKAFYPQKGISAEKCSENKGAAKGTNCCREYFQKPGKKQNPGTVIKKECCQRD